MNSLIEKEVEENPPEETWYFFTFLNGRFEHLNELWTKALEKKFNKKFEPIHILSAKEKEESMRKKRNYFILNTMIEESFSELKKRGNHLCFQEEPDDLNKIFSESPDINNHLEKLSKKQDIIPIIAWSNSGFKLNNQKIKYIGPATHLSEKYDSKIEQTKLFEKLDLPRIESKIYSNIQELKEKITFPAFVYANKSSGGYENGPLYGPADLDKFISELRKENKKQKFLISKLIKQVKHSPNVSAIVLEEGKTEIVCITDQILRQNKYLGNIYPSRQNEETKKKIIEITKKVGDYLSKEGYKGLFGLDFIIDDKNNLYIVDLNPRRQGGYLCNVLMSKKFNLIEIELDLAMGEKPTFDYESHQVDYSWGHIKLKPYYNYITINEELKEGEQQKSFENIGERYAEIYYPTKHLFFGGCVGYLIITEKTYEEVQKKLLKESEIFISKCLELYTI